MGGPSANARVDYATGPPLGSRTEGVESVALARGIARAGPASQVLPPPAGAYRASTTPGFRRSRRLVASDPPVVEGSLALSLPGANVVPWMLVTDVRVRGGTLYLE